MKRATQQHHEDLSEGTLADLYNEASRAMKSAELLPRGDERQDLFIKARLLFEKSMDIVERLSLFSDNEQVDDIATENLKYLLIPAYLSKIAVSSETNSDRLQTFIRAENLINSFFERLAHYGMVESGTRESKANATTLESAMQARNEKIAKYKNMRMLEAKLEELESRIASGDFDDETTRQYYLNLLKKWVEDSHETLEAVIKPAISFEKNRGQEPKPSPPREKGKTFTIVKDDIQKTVFGLGYPSRPTVTIEQFINKKIDEGELAIQKPIYSNSLQRYAEQPNLRKEQEELSDTERESKEERDDEEELFRKRAWDEFKDENPRGSGNRHNMG